MPNCFVAGQSTSTRRLRTAALTLCPQQAFAIGTGRSDDRKDSTSRVEEAIGKPSPLNFGRLRF